MWPLSNYFFFLVTVFLNLLPGSQRLNHKTQILRQVLHGTQISTQLFNHNFNISVFTDSTSMFSSWSLFPTLRDQMNNCQKCSLVKSSFFKAVSTCFAEEQKERQGQSNVVLNFVLRTSNMHWSTFLQKTVFYCFFGFSYMGFAFIC